MGTETYIVVGIILASAYLGYRKMAKAGSPFFKIGYFLYTKTRIGHIYYRREVDKAHRKYNDQGHSIVEPTSFNGLKILPIAISLDNYSYLILDERSSTGVLVDPADPDPIQNVLDKEKVTPIAVLTTHKHWDHSGGNNEWRSRYPGIRIIGGAMDAVPGATESVADGDILEFGQLIFTVHFTPGHTVGHVIYTLDGNAFGAPTSVFSGDHLFLGGTGRMFEGAASTMLRSLDSICQLPDSTLLWPGHEYAQDNLEFAHHLEPDNNSIQEKHNWVKEMRKDRKCTSPSTIGEEKKYNPYLRVHEDNLLFALGIEKDKGGVTDTLRAQCLAECRARKDKFKYKL